jgi:RNA polymerase sigma-70 factor (ECF subfamily)
VAETPAEDPLVRYRQYLLMLARVTIDPRLQSRMDAEDIVQQTLMEAHQSRHQFVGSAGEMAAWLRRMLSNNMADALRGLARAKRDVARQRSLEQELEHSSDRLQAWVAADQSSPSQHAVREERGVMLANALSELPDAQREALILQYWHGWSLAEIAAHLERTPAAVAGLLKRGMRELRERLSGGESETFPQPRA